MRDFSGQTAIVTGAASGIGHAISTALIHRGATVALLDIDAHALDRLYGGGASNVRLYEVDITDEALVNLTVDRIAAENGRIDILVNSAGITGVTNRQSHLVDSEDLRRIFDVNFMASFLMAKAVLPHMLSRNYGRILHIASIAGKEGNAGMLGYSASKAAVIGMAKVQGKEYAGTGITVNALAPAVIRTPMVDALPDEQVRYMTDKIPMKRCGTLEEAVNMVMYIVSPQNSFSTGFTFDLSGGRATY